jgi:hypothetical protein
MGGNIVQCAHLFIDALHQKLKAVGIRTPLIKAQLGEEAAIIGFPVY